MKSLILIPVLALAILTLSAALSPAVACVPSPGGCCESEPFAKTKNGIAYTCRLSTCLIGVRLDR
jgi:hypothetical protein